MDSNGCHRSSGDRTQLEHTHPRLLLQTINLSTERLNMKRKHITQAGVYGTALALLLTACGTSEAVDSGPGSIEDMEEITLTIADWQPPGDYIVDTYQDFIDEVEERTDGKINFETYYAGSLLSANEILSGVSAGTADIGRIVATYHPQELPVSNWVQNHFAATHSMSYPTGFIQGTSTAHEIFTTDENILEEYSNHNIVPITAVGSSQNYSLTCNTPIEDPEEISGIRTRVGGEVWSREAEAMGLDPVSLEVSEMYEGLQRGVIECVSSPISLVLSMGLWDVADYHLAVNTSQTNAMPFAMNQDTWNSLPADAQKIIKDAAIDILWKSSVEGVLDTYAEFAEDGVGERGIEVLDPTKFNDVLAVHQESVLDEAEDKAPNEVGEPEAFITNYLDTQEFWLKTASDELGVDSDATESEDIVKAYSDGANLEIDTFTDILRERRG